MIVDRIENWNHYDFGKAWQRAFDFLTSLGPDAAEKKYALQGQDIFAIIVGYETRKPEKAVLEAHKKYVDLHISLVGSESIEWFPLNDLQVKTPYDASNDAEIYYRHQSGSARVNLHPGTFVALFPQDGHMAQLTLGDAPEQMKKVVVKINIELLNQSFADKK